MGGTKTKIIKGSFGNSNPGVASAHTTGNPCHSGCLWKPTVKGSGTLVSTGIDGEIPQSLEGVVILSTSRVR
jgi:hypothetical protein